MESLSFFALLCLTLARSAPLHEHEHDLRRVAENAKSLAQKILSGIPAAHAASVTDTGLTLSSEDISLEYLLSEIGIPAPPLLKSEDLTLDMRLSRIRSGLDLHARLLQAIGSGRSSEEMKSLIADVQDLSAQTQQMQRVAQSPESQDVVPFSLRMDSEYKQRVAAHLSLQQLRSFTQDVLRSLRLITLTLT